MCPGESSHVSPGIDTTAASVSVSSLWLPEVIWWFSWAFVDSQVIDIFYTLSQQHFAQMAFRLLAVWSVFCFWLLAAQCSLRLWSQEAVNWLWGAFHRSRPAAVKTPSRRHVPSQSCRSVMCLVASSRALPPSDTPTPGRVSEIKTSSLMSGFLKIVAPSPRLVSSVGLRRVCQ